MCKTSVRTFQNKAQFILPKDLGGYSTQIDPRKEEAEGSVSERFVDNASL